MKDFLVNPAIDQYCFDQTTPEPPLLQELIDATNEQMGYPVKLSGRIIGRLLKLITQLSQTKTVLEIGMFTGYSALSIAEALPEDGKVICCETNPRAIEFAQSFFDRSPHGHKIEVRFGKALDTINTLRDLQFDMVFVDADKKNYFNYLKATFPLVRSGGLFVIDNALWQGNVLNPNDERDQAIVELNQHIATNPQLENVFLSVRDGVNLVRKNS
ncbi:class I SAM-dependent methyltransferase [Endozoicomonas sp. SM1973]|uniref:Class I SAM-dependent methyltransferase n=2 Tax=Spartinivicinus marinus TaxID=2994442 RepID=A0A853I7B7_9GAMM|nr:class I SAM-dependent methyltransferase [Spartinivicinus marinus]MCX4028769.1 class I SAM-dependent methyltransferase [Spartinivicinus marinus]NYZ67582.1 class I SAM-dependent methyltransferase [Spartinivicinus marinus]